MFWRVGNPDLQRASVLPACVFSQKEEALRSFSFPHSNAKEIWSNTKLFSLSPFTGCQSKACSNCRGSINLKEEKFRYGFKETGEK